MITLFDSVLMKFNNAVETILFVKRIFHTLKWQEKSIYFREKTCEINIKPECWETSANLNLNLLLIALSVKDIKNYFSIMWCYEYPNQACKTEIWKTVTVKQSKK